MKSSDHTLSRRNLIKLGAAGAVGLAIPQMAHATETVLSTPARSPKNVIVMVSDGMSLGVPSLTEPFAKLIRKRGTLWHKLQRNANVYHGFFDMSSLNSLVTDSAAASSSWGSGSRVFNKSINTLPDGTKLTPIGAVVKKHGLAFGLVTTVTVTHATPAGFTASHPSRDDQDAIALQYLDLPDVILGGGKKFFLSEKRKDKQDILGEFSKKGYAILASKKDLLKASSKTKLIGLFSDDYLPMSIDRLNQPKLAEAIPSLREMTEKALSTLSTSNNGFLLQVEAGRVDHAAHANDLAGILWDQLEFDDAIEAVWNFTLKNPDTLVIVTSDHGNSNPGLNGVGSEYRLSDSSFANVTKFKRSSLDISQEISKRKKENLPIERDWLAKTIKDATTIELKDTEIDALLSSTQDQGSKYAINKQHQNFVGILGQILGNYTGVQWTGTQHTSDLTPILAWGPGAERFGKLLANVEMFSNILGLLKIDFTNPSLPPSKATQYQPEPPISTSPHWLDYQS